MKTLGLIADISGDVAHIVWDLPDGDILESVIPSSALPVDAYEGGWICTASVSVVANDNNQEPISHNRRSADCEF